MSLRITIQVRDNEVKAHSFGNSNWLALTQWSGTWDTNNRNIESNIALHFHSQEDVKHVISQLEHMLATWVDTSDKEEVQP
jgi:hypothetical protein